MYFSSAKLMEDGSCILYLNRDDDPGEKIGSITATGEIKANYKDNELVAMAVMDGLKKMGFADKYNEIIQELMIETSKEEIFVKEVINCFETNYKDRLVNIHRIRENSIEECFEALLAIENNLPNKRFHHLRINNQETARKYQEWKILGSRVSVTA